MSIFGLVLLLLVAVLVPLTGLPSFLILLFAAAVGAVAGVLSDTIPAALLAALPIRVVNLLENDLLQALPLYVLMGALMNRLPIADAIFQTSLRMMPGRAAAPAVAAMGMGALLGPMNGSVGASIVALSRSVASRLRSSGMSPPGIHALIAVASTFGIVVPPSLVLILLGDAMMGAHTIALNVSHRSDQVINTQDLFRGALLPAALFLLGCVVVAFLDRGSAPSTVARPSSPGRGAALIAMVYVAFVIGLLVGVASGRFYAVEGAAAGAFVLFVTCAASGRLSNGALRELLRETMTTTGVLFMLLVAATTFTLVFRLLGSDRLLDEWISNAPFDPQLLTAIVLLAIALAGLALDAFEIIFVLVPILMPPLLTRVPDATWVAVMLLLALQASFLLPPVGYALLMVRGVLREHVDPVALARRVAPFLFVQLLVLVLVLGFPRLVHFGKPEVSAMPVPMTDEEVRRKMQDMLPRAAPN